MLQLRNICKSYTTGSFTQKALDNVSISFRDNEFVAILGPSGSGKTTMLNIVGGLDHYDSGDLVIEGISTEKYKDRDWDTYRNNRIGFVFQSYNLIPHQTVLANVELALTLSGVSREERRKRAAAALERVGLGDHKDKKPSQMSGGQMQRVAIARALINDPEILLADEPTGALDSKTSVQIMDLLTEIAEDRLVVMVTHNPELAEEYATRIVNLADGHILSDTDPYEPTEEEIAAANAKPSRRTRMSFLTALSLSANNLMSKKGRTIMTAIAGSIGIIGIAAIMALANGVNNYIKTVEAETLSVYPLQIMSTGFDLTTMMLGSSAADDDSSDSSKSSDSPESSDSSKSADSAQANSETAEGTIGEARMMNRMFSSIGSNDLKALKQYFDSGDSGIQNYASSVEYEYSVTPQIYAADTSDGVRQVNPDKSFASLGIGSSASSNSIMSMSMSTDVFSEMMSNTEIVEGQYDVVAGHWPENENELVLVLTQSGRISDFMSYVLGLRDHKELEKMVKQFADEEEVKVVDDENLEIAYDDVLGMKFKLVNAADYYKFDDEYDVWVDKSDDKKYLKKLVNNGEDLVIAGIVQPKPEATATALTSGLYYTPELTRHIVEKAAQSKIVKQQLKKPKIDVFSGKSFDEAKEENGDFDMTSLFSIDEDAITTAFSFDESALDFSSMDLSNLNFDFSNIDFSDVDLSQLDLPEPDLDAISQTLPQVTAEDIVGLFPELSDPSILEDVEIKFKNDDTSAQDALVNGITAWVQGQIMSGNMNPDVTEFLNSDEGRALIADVGESIDVDALQEQVSEAIAKQLGTSPDKVGDVVAQRVVEYYSKQMTDSMQEQLQTVMQDYITEVLTQGFDQLSVMLESQIQTAMDDVMSQLSGNMESVLGNLPNAFQFDQDAFMNAFQFNMTQEELAELMASMMYVEEHSYDNNLKKLGYADFDKPSQISIYPRDFECKAEIINILDSYNDRMRQTDEDKVISYTDIVGTLMESVTDIINKLSAVLIAFVAISLIVSSIMIGVITYISVLERKKEIGILRSIGASKGDISRVFNAETIIEGLFSGLLGVGVTALGCIPANIIVYEVFDVPNIAMLPVGAAVTLVVISVVLTFISGVIPSQSASRKDPVEALRSE